MRTVRVRRVRTGVGAGAGGDDAGQVLLLLLVYAMVTFSLIMVVLGATAVHLERNRLTACADAAALDAADSLDEESFLGGRSGALPPPGAGGAAGVPLTDAGVRSSVAGYLEASGASTRFDLLAVDPATGSPDGRTAEVTLTAVARLPLVTPVLAGWADGLPLRVTARARARILP